MQKLSIRRGPINLVPILFNLWKDDNSSFHRKYRSLTSSPLMGMRRGMSDSIAVRASWNEGVQYSVCTSWSDWFGANTLQSTERWWFVFSQKIPQLEYTFFDGDDKRDACYDSCSRVLEEIQLPFKCATSTQNWTYTNHTMERWWFVFSQKIPQLEYTFFYGDDKRDACYDSCSRILEEIQLRFKCAMSTQNWTCTHFTMNVIHPKNQNQTLFSSNSVSLFE